MSRTFTKLVYHVVFATKERRAVLTPDVTEGLYPYLAGAVGSEGGRAFAINGSIDHVHVLARLRQDKALSDVIREIKANSSLWIHRTFTTHRSFAWQGGYSAFTVSESQQERVARYVENQESRHRSMTFTDELAAMLAAHSIPFDARYSLT